MLARDPVNGHIHGLTHYDDREQYFEDLLDYFPGLDPLQQVRGDILAAAAASLSAAVSLSAATAVFAFTLSAAVCHLRLTPPPCCLRTVFCLISAGAR
jgi:hypothetical protein